MPATASARGTLYLSARFCHLLFAPSPTPASHAFQLSRNSAKMRRRSSPTRSSEIAPNLRPPAPSLSRMLSGISSGAGRPSRSDARLQALMSMLQSLPMSSIDACQHGCRSARDTTLPASRSPAAPTSRRTSSIAASSGGTVSGPDSWSATLALP